MSLRRFDKRGRVAIYLAPTLIAVACIIGLIAGLLGEGGLADTIAAIGLGLPLPVLGWALWRRRR